MVTLDRLREVLDYNPETGVFIWKARPATTRAQRVWNTRYAGKPAGRRHRKRPGCKTLYTAITIDNRPNVAHRLAWLWVYGSLPNGELDHIDRNGENNSIANLREATSTLNKINQGIRKDNLSGRRGVSWDATRQKWRAEIAVNGQSMALGRFTSFGDACGAREAAEHRYHA